jgi:hypothetical protein
MKRATSSKIKGGHNAADFLGHFLEAVFPTNMADFQHRLSKLCHNTTPAVSVWYLWGNGACVASRPIVALLHTVDWYTAAGALLSCVDGPFRPEQGKDQIACTRTYPLNGAMVSPFSPDEDAHGKHA